MYERVLMRWWVGAVFVALIATARVAAADAPRVVELVPENGAADVDPGITELRVVFDRDMNTGGISVCGGGPTFPKLRGRPKWVDERTFVMKVKLKSDHEYTLSLNCPSATNFRSADGTALEPVQWTFSTASKRRKGGKRGKRDKAERPDDPQIVKMFPKNGAIDVDPGITELRVVFDRDMDTSGYSFCGGGPTFPKPGNGRTEWIDERTIVMRVKLEPDHDYEMLLNCPAAQSFLSADDTPLEPAPWSFSTAAKTGKLSKSKQKKLNARCLKELMKALRDHYSYHELRDIDWKALQKKHGKKIVAAKSTRSWIKRVAKMLAEAKDMHLWLTYRGKTTHPYKRKIKQNYSLDGIKKVLPGFKQRNRCVYTARTDDDIGYIMITTLSHSCEEDLEEVQGILEEYADCKGLIIDLRPNGGGAEPLAKPIAAWFVKGKKTYAKNVYRDPDAESGFTKVFDRTITGNDEPRRFDKPVAVLSGRAIMSSAEAFLLMMKQGEAVTVIGSRSYGSSGNPKPHTLQNDVELFIPSWKAMRPDGTCFEGEGIEPDIEVKAKASAFKKGDPVIGRALEHLRE